MAKIPEEIRTRLRSPGARIALVGASNDHHKYGNIILLDLLHKGYEVIPINPGCLEVAGLRAYPHVADVPGEVDLIDFVVPPGVAHSVVADLSAEVCDALWFQPGAFDAEVVRAAEERFPYVVAGPCIMVETRTSR